MIELHCHTTLSDGDLIPAELVRRAAVEGVTTICITDHVDEAVADWSIPLLARFAVACEDVEQIRVLAGAEITHVPPRRLAALVPHCRELGARIVLCHGETIVEPTTPGTNRAAILAGVDVLAHPGLISEADVKLAAERDVRLEISARKGHCLANGHVAAMARRYGAKLVFGSDAHTVGDLHGAEAAERVLRGAGLSEKEVAAAFKEAEALTDI